jgi:TPR repeat protein
MHFLYTRGLCVLKETIIADIVYWMCTFVLQGVGRDYERAAEAYMHAQSQSNAQAMFNLGYMHEHGHGLPLDLHLAKRYYDQAVEVDPAAKLPVMLALTSLWIRKNYDGSFLVRHYFLYVSHRCLVSYKTYQLIKHLCSLLGIFQV